MVSSHQPEEAEASSKAQKQAETLPGSEAEPRSWGPAVWRPWVQGRAGERGRGKSLGNNGNLRDTKQTTGLRGFLNLLREGEPAERSCRKLSFSSNAAIPMQVRVTSRPCETRILRAQALSAGRKRLFLGRSCVCKPGGLRGCLTSFTGNFWF